MQFNDHSQLRDKHAILSPSSYHWLNYDEAKMASRFKSLMAAKRGTDLHQLAHDAIRLGIKLNKANLALSTYVLDGINHKMVTEQPLFYSRNCFGTADCISFHRNRLRIHDLKTGVTATSMQQLIVYAAIFCLEYGYSPYDIDIILRIYQREDIREHIPHPDEVAEVMDKIVYFDQQVEELRATDNL